MTSPAVARETRVAGSIVRSLGRMGTFTRAGEMAGLPVATVITRESAPVWGGEVRVREDHYRGYLLASSLPADPAVGDGLTVDAERYQVDEAPAREHGLWALTLRRLP